MLKIGIIGSVRSADLYVQAINSISGLELIGLFDPSVNISQNSQISGFDIYTLAETLFIDVSIICVTEKVVNFELISKAVKKAKHIILPFPFILRKYEADILLKIAGEAGVKVQFSLNDYYYHVFSNAYEIVKNPLYIESRISENVDMDDSSCGPYEKLMYDILIILNLVSCDIRRVLTHNVSVFRQRPELINIRLEFNNGCVADFISDSVSDEQKHIYLFFQKGSVISFDLLKQKTEIAVEAAEHEKSDIASSKSLIKDKYNKLEYETVNFPSHETLKDVLKSFIDCIKEDSQPKINLENYLSTCQVIQSISDKIENT